jgi:hypothetical protein
LVIASIAGVPFEDYVDARILGPLGMSHTTFREPWTNLDLEPMSAELAADSSTGYTRKNGGYDAGDFEFIHQLAPAGSLSTTAADMARYMLMHLGEGSYDGVQILAPDTARQMQQRQFGHDGDLNGIAHGFFEDWVHGYRTIGHGGGTLYFLSDMVMVPELEFGLFVSTNTNTGYRLISGLADMVIGRYFPIEEERAAPEPPEDFAERGKRFAGTYISNRRSYTQLEKLPMLFMSAVEVSVTEDGYLVLGTPGEATRFVEVAPLTFREVEGDGALKFVEDSKGRITRILSDVPAYVLDRAAIFDRPSTVIVVSAAALVLSLGVLIAAWYRRRQRIEQTAGERFASVLLALTAATWVAFFVVSGVALVGMGSGLEQAMFDFPSTTLVWALVIALAATVETVVCAVLLYPVWARASWSVGRRLRHTVVVLVLVVLVIMLDQLNVIGFNYF